MSKDKKKKKIGHLQSTRRGYGDFAIRASVLLGFLTSMYTKTIA